MSIWSDVFNIFTYSSEPDPLSRVKDTQRFQPVGITQPDALNYETGGGLANLRQTTEFIDTTTLTSRPMRYKEYQRLRNVPEIEMAMQGIADEACIAGDTKIATPFGFITIKELVETKAGERFLVYCFDFEKNDYTLGWAYNPRVVREAETVTVILDNGSKFTVTADHRILKSDGTWIEAGKLKYYDELMPFYRLPANFYLTKQKHSQYSRIFSFQKGWIHERQFINDWKTGKVEESYEKYNKASKMIGNGVPVRTIQKIMDHDWNTIQNWFKREGFSHKEIKVLYKNENKRRVIGIEPGPKQEVYDLSVDKHQCFATDSVIMHNCQKDENGNILKINVQNREIKEELEFVLFHRKMFNLNRTAPVWFKNLIINGDLFLEMVINEDNPKDGFYRAVSLPPEQIFRIETIKGRLLEFQQAKDAPDIKAAIAGTEGQANVDEKQTNVIRFHPGQLIHIRIGDDRQTFYPYGQSLIEPARGPAHSLRLMEDAMLVYRLCLTEDARVRTDNGWKYIKDINKNDCVYTFCPDGHLVKSYVENQVCNGKKEIYRVRSKHIEIKGTETHPILVDRDGVVQYVDIKDIRVKKDKFLCIPHESNVEKTIPRIFQKPWAKLSKNMRDEFRRKKYENKSVLLKNCYNSCRAKQFLYQEGKALPLDKAIGICKLFDLNSNELVIINKGECNSNRINIPKIVDKDFARLFGFIYGDGNIREHQINFTTGEDSSVNEKYRALLENYFGKVSFQLDKRSKKGHGKQVVNSTIACEIFKALGYEKNHNTCRVPGWIFNCSKEIRKAFVEGFSDADGCERYTKNGTWFSTIELSNKGLVEDIKELWSSIGLCSGHIKERHRKGGHEITKGRIMPASTSYSVTISECLLPKFENIISVEHAGEEDVYDITVSNPEHNFIVNGTCVHNTRAPERRVFYIDVGQLPPFKAEAYIDRLKDQYRKRKTTNSRASGANAVEEKWTPPAQDEDYWVPTRPNSATRIDTLPGAEHLGEIDDAIYFRNKLFTALNFPKNYLNNEDPSTARVSLSYLDSRFARMIERLQGHFEDGILEIAEKHLKMRGFPEESFQDLKIKMTPPSEHREVSRADVLAARYSNAGTLKSAEMMSDFDIYTQIFKYTKDEAEEMLSRLKLQKLENLKLQVLAQNPALMGIGIPGEESQEPELGAEPGGPSDMPPLDGKPPQEQQQDLQGGQDQQGQNQPAPLNSDGKGISQVPPEGVNIPEPSAEDLKKYDLELQNYESEQDAEDIDYSSIE